MRIYNSEPPPYVNDGTTIPDWSHLLLSEEEFLTVVEATRLGTCAGLSRHVTDYVYKCAAASGHPHLQTRLRSMTAEFSWKTPQEDTARHPRGGGGGNTGGSRRDCVKVTV